MRWRWLFTLWTTETWCPHKVVLLVIESKLLLAPTCTWCHILTICTAISLYRTCLQALWQGDFVSCGTKAVCSMAYIHPIILCITRRESNDVVHDFDVITNWDLTILCPRVIKRTVTGCMATESTEGLHFTYHWRGRNVFTYAGWYCRKEGKSNPLTCEKCFH